MAYSKQEWKDRRVQNNLTFNITNNPDGTITLSPAPGAIEEAGTMITAQRMNHIEDGIEMVEKEVEESILESHPIGSIFATEEDINPHILIGGDWELIKNYTGGELIAYGVINNSKSNTTAIARDARVGFSDSRIPNKEYKIVNYIENVLSFESGTFLIKPQGVAGMVDTICSIGGLGGSGLTSIWYHANENPLPTGVEMVGDYEAMKTMTGAYCGSSIFYQYIIGDNAAEDTQFFVNPSFSPYGGALTPCSGGVCCSLQVKIYARKGTTYVWQRVS